MQHPERFICISYSKIDFLIPNDDVHTAVSLKEFDVEQMCGPMSGIYNFDEIAMLFKEPKVEKNVHTMIMLKKKDSSQISFITTSECRVCVIPLENFSLFSDYYAQSLFHLGILACNFENDRMRYLLDVRKLIDYVNDGVEGEI
ncbi:MAG: hypothetical protein IJ688_12925 [Treponema sp.]|nr:hypothetical protein [Treponema sp.]